MTIDLAIFDLDHTLLTGDSDYLWGQFLCDQGVVERGAYEAENRRYYELYEAGKLDIHAFAAFSLQPLVDNDPHRMIALRETFVREIINPLVAEAAPALLEKHRIRGDELLIMTSTNTFITQPIAELLGVGTLLATDPEIIDGRYTGRISGVPCFRDGKVTRLAEWCDAMKIAPGARWFYSDSYNDRPLLDVVEHPVAVDPDETLAAYAELMGWPVISLREPPIRFEVDSDIRSD